MHLNIKSLLNIQCSLQELRIKPNHFERKDDIIINLNQFYLVAEFIIVNLEM